MRFSPSRPTLFWRRVVLVILLAAASRTADAADWPRFRGPGGLGTAEEQSLPLTWSPEENIRWRVELPGPGNSSPIVVGERVFVTVSTDEGRRRTLHSLDRASGAALWARGVDIEAPETTHKTNPYCSPSPAADAEHVVVWYANGGTHCYDHDGKPLWSRELGSFEHIWGFGSSPIIYEDRVFLNCGPGERTFVIALDLETGETLWQTDEPGGASGLEKTNPDDKREPWIGSWSTPVVAHVDGQNQVIVSMPHHVQGYDPQTGEILWRCRGLGDLVYTSVVHDGHVAVATGGFRGPQLAFELGGSGDVTETHRLWRNDEGIPQRISSGVIVGPHLFMANEPGTAECIELETGRQVWKERISATKIWGSIIHADGRLYVTNQDGDTIVFAPDAEKLEKLAVNSLGEPSNATPAVSDGQIFLRTDKALYRISE